MEKKNVEENLNYWTFLDREDDERLNLSKTNDYVTDIDLEMNHIISSREDQEEKVVELIRKNSMKSGKVLEISES